MEIREYKKDDIKACLNIYNHYIENTTVSFEEQPHTAESLGKRFSGITEKYPFLVAVDGENILGYAYLNEFNSRSAYRYTVDLSIYLSKDVTGAGIGTALYKEIENSARKCGYKNIISLITGENDASVAFHKKMGFKKVGTLKNVGVKFGKTLDVYYYQKEI